MTADNHHNDTSGTGSTGSADARNTRKSRPTIPRHEITADGQVVPAGTAEQEDMYLFAEDADAGVFLDEIAPDDEADEIRTAWSVYDESERVVSARRHTGKKPRKTLARATSARLAQEDQRWREHREEQATTGMRGFWNKIGLHLAASAAESSERSREHASRVAKIHSQAIKRSVKEISSSPLDIMVDADGEWRCPAVAVCSSKGGVGKSTIIGSLGEMFAEALVDSDLHSGLPAVLIDLNPDYGTVVSRIPEMRNSRRMSVDSYKLGTMCVEHLENPQDSPEFNALDHTWPTKWEGLRGITNPPGDAERKRMEGYRISAIYDCLSDRSSVFFMDNGTQLTSMQMVTSASLANVLIFIIEASTPENQLETQLADWYHTVQVNRNAFAGLSERMVVAIVPSTNSASQRKSARNLTKLLTKKGIDSVNIPFDRYLADSGPIDLAQTSTVYRSAIAQLASLVLGNMNKDKSLRNQQIAAGK